MKEILPIKEALIKLTLLRRRGLNVFAQFRCELCDKLNRVPSAGESQAAIKCGRCDEVNYLTEYEVVKYI